MQYSLKQEDQILLKNIKDKSIEYLKSIKVDVSNITNQYYSSEEISKIMSNKEIFIASLTEDEKTFIIEMNNFFSF